MRAIFISYRREDAEGQAGRLFKDLVQHFGEQAVFMDVAGIEPGRDFRKAIDEHVTSCGVLLAVIGKHWLDAADEAGRRRLDDPNDFVRLETASALRRDIPVMPVLVHGARMPRADQLPADLADLAYRNAIELTHARWDSDVSLLVKALGRHVTIPQGSAASGGPVGGEPAAPAARPPKTRLLAAAALAVAIAAGVYLFKPDDGSSGQTAAVPEAKAIPTDTSSEEASDIQAVPIAQRYSAFGVADWDRDGHQDILTRENATGSLWLYPGDGTRGFSRVRRVKIDNNLGDYTPFGVADWDGDGHQDFLARSATGELWLFPGESKRSRSSAPRVQIGIGWNEYTPFGLADWDDDDHQDIVVRADTDNELWLYPGESKRGVSTLPRAQIGIGWKGYVPFGLADWDGDGHRDIVVRAEATGELWLYPGESTRDMSTPPRASIGIGWSDYSSFGLTDWDGDGHQDVVARHDPTGELWLYPGESKRVMSTPPRARIGSLL